MTLIETLVVVAITVLLSAIAFPSLDRLAGAMAVSEARVTFVSDLRVARAQAMRGDRPVTVSFAPNGQSYAVGRRVVDLPASARIRAGRSVVFAADGSAAASVMTFDGRTGRQTVRIDPVTGAISVANAR